MAIKERRDARRKKVMIPAVVSDRDASNSIKCMISSASMSGCRIKFQRTEELPDEIYVQVQRLKQPIKGKIVWREGRRAGVQFFWDEPQEGDKRSESRLESEIPAVISDHQQSRSIDCVVQNESGSGCVVVADQVADLPDEVSIKFENSDEPIKGKIIWRNGDKAGVEFAWQTTENEPNDGQDEDETPDTVLI